MKQKTICECCGSIEHKFDARIIHGPKVFPLILIRNMNHVNSLHGKEPNETSRQWNCQPPAAHLKFNTSPPKTSPIVSDIMGKPNHYSIDIVDAEVHPSYFPVESNS